MLSKDWEVSVLFHFLLGMYVLIETSKFTYFSANILFLASRLMYKQRW